MEYKVTMGYIGGVLSDNSYKLPTRGTKPFVSMWMRELAEKVRVLAIPERTEYIIKIDGRFADERRPDISNLHKVVGDSLKKGIGVDDKWFRYQDGTVKLGFLNNPQLDITIEIKDVE